MLTRAFPIFNGMIKLIAILRQLHKYYNKSKFLQGIFGILFLIRNHKILRFFYYGIKYFVLSIGWITTLLSALVTDPIGSITMVTNY